MVFRPEVFLSATPVELDAYREVVRKALREIGARVVEQTDLSVPYGPLQGVLYQQMQRCEVVIHLVGKHYGLEPTERTLGAPRRSFAQYEFDVARSQGKLTFCYLTTSQTPVAPLPPEDPERITLQREYRAVLERTEEHLHTFTDADDLARQIRALRPRIMIRRQLVRLPREHLGDRLVGRKQLMETLRTELDAGGLVVLHLPADPAVTAGTGRTTLAFELGWQLHQEGRFPYVFALPGGPRADMEVALAALARSDALGLLPDEVAGHKARLDAVLQWFRREENAGRWLVILDGVEDAATWVRVKALLPLLGKGAILVTSRIRHWPEDTRAFSVGAWGTEQSRDYVLNRVLPGKPHNRTELAATERLVDGLGRLPLAVELLAAHLAESKETPSEFLAPHEGKTRGLTPEGFAAPYAPTLPEVIEQSTEALDAFTRSLVRQIACFAPQPASVPLAIFEHRGDWSQIRVSLIALEARALVTMENEGRSVSMHRTIRDALLGAMGSSEHSIALGAALGSVDTVLRRAQGNSIALRDALIPHCRALLAKLDKNPLELHAATIAQTYANWLLDSGRAAEAEPFFRRALRIDQKRLGQDHPEIAQRLRDIVSVLRVRGRAREAEPLARRALAVTEKASGSEHPDAVIDLYNVAACLRALNRFDEAEQLYRRALHIEERHAGLTHPRVAIALHRLASLLEVAGRLVEAEGLYHRAQAIDERTFAPQHPRVIAGLHNLAGILATLGKHAKAEEALRHALAADERTYGTHHLEIAPALKLLASLVAGRDDFAEAEALLRRSLEIDEAALGPEHSEVAADLGSLSGVLYTTGRFDEARSLAERAVDIYLLLGKRLRREHPQLRPAFALLGDIKRAQGVTEEQIAADERKLRGVGAPKREHAEVKPVRRAAV